MIYLSAQPDEVYFLWQLQLQIYNFSTLGIPKSYIHVLIGYDPQKGLHPFFQRFIQENNEVGIFAYADTRDQTGYLSSLRPHLIAKHIKQHPELENEVVFYHDSDIIFRCLPDWESLINDPVWYVSDTRSYLDSQYILSQTTETVFQKMCEIVGISPQQVKAEDLNAGGAQYLLKNCRATFWEKVERDCETMYAYLYAEAKQQGHYNPLKDGGLQLWCTDMWVVWWNALLENRKVKIHPSLDFCWANDPIEKWEDTRILHYTGNSRQNKNAFDKTLYTHISPFYSDLSGIENSTCSIRLVEEIEQYKQNVLDAARPDIPDVTLVYLQPAVGNRLSLCLERFVTRYLNMTVECRPKQTFDSDYQAISTAYRIVCREPWIATAGVLLQIVQEIRKNQYAEIAFRFPAFRLDPLGRQIFSFVMDEGYLTENQGKMKQSENPVEIRAFAPAVKREEIKLFCREEPVYIF